MPIDGCAWTTPPGGNVVMEKQSEKPGRICWSVDVPTGYAVHWQSNGDIYHSWNAGKCCQFEGLSSNTTNVVTFTPQYGNFGFCECINWAPQTGSLECAGQATAEAMICPVEGSTDTKEMCSDSTSPNTCGGGQPTPTSAPTPTQAPTQAPTPGCSDENQNCESWAASGQCEANPNYMLVNCRKSCGVCSGPGPAPTPAPTPPPGPGICCYEGCGSGNCQEGWCSESQGNCEGNCFGEWCTAAGLASLKNTTSVPVGPGLCCWGGCGGGHCQGGWCGESQGHCEENCHGEFCPAAGLASLKNTKKHV